MLCLVATNRAGASAANVVREWVGARGRLAGLGTTTRTLWAWWTVVRAVRASASAWWRRSALTRWPWWAAGSDSRWWLTGLDGLLGNAAAGADTLLRAVKTDAQALEDALAMI